MALWTRGPETAAEDEQAIGRGYQMGWGQALAAAPLILAGFADLKWVLAVGLFVLITLLHEAGGRLYDLCIRTRRTNLLLAEIRNRLSEPPFPGIR